jgi:hypothetical protein
MGLGMKKDGSQIIISVAYMFLRLIVLCKKFTKVTPVSQMLELEGQFSKATLDK